MNAKIRPHHQGLQKNVRLLSTKAYDHFKGTSAKKKASFESALKKYDQKNFDECLEIVRSNPDNDPLFFKNESVFQCLGPKISQGAQIFLAHAYLRKTRTKFDFESFKTAISAAGFDEIAREMKKSYFANIRMSDSKSRISVRIGGFKDAYFAKLDLFVSKDYLPAQVFENKGLLGHIASFCGEREIARLAQISPKTNFYLFASCDSRYTYKQITTPLVMSVPDSYIAEHRTQWLLPEGRRADNMHGESIFITNLQTGLDEHILHGHTSVVQAVTGLPEGRLASGTRCGTIKIWNLQTGACEHTFPCPTGVTVGVSFGVTFLKSLPEGRLACVIGSFSRQTLLIGIYAALF